MRDVTLLVGVGAMVLVEHDKWWVEDSREIFDGFA